MNIASKTGLGRQRKVSLSHSRTPQTQAIAGREADMKSNHAGGVVFKLEKWAFLDRFLIMGAENSKYYVQPQALTPAKAANAIACLHEDGNRFIDRVVDISEAGRAPKNDAAIFCMALALTMGDSATKLRVRASIGNVCRTGTHILQFVAEINALRGWGHAATETVASWYLNKDIDALAYQLVKYRNRADFTHRDALRLSHVRTDNKALAKLLGWVTGKNTSKRSLPLMVRAFIEAQEIKDVSKARAAIAALFEKCPKLPWEALPTEALAFRSTWELLLKRLPMHALVRNLGRMTTLGVFEDESNVDYVCERLRERKIILDARMHPIALLYALRTYAKGSGVRGNLAWTPVRKIVNALNDAFYLAFANIKASGKRFYLGVDVSGSMDSTDENTVVTPRDIAAAMALVTMAAEPKTHIFGFSHKLVKLDVSPNDRLDDVAAKMRRQDFGGTDCALPMLHAIENDLKVDVFVVYTDNETWAGRIQPVEALARYRKKTGINAKLVVVGIDGNDFTIADPNDIGMLDVVGFDSAAPGLISDFAAQ